MKTFQEFESEPEIISEISSITTLIMSTPVEYKGYTIQEDYRNPYSNKPEFMFYLTEQGVQHDADYDGEQYKYCGNCKWADSIEEAKEEIDEITD